MKVKHSHTYDNKIILKALKRLFIMGARGYASLGEFGHCKHHRVQTKAVYSVTG